MLVQKYKINKSFVEGGELAIGNAVKDKGSPTHGFVSDIDGEFITITCPKQVDMSADIMIDERRIILKEIMTDDELIEDLKKLTRYDPDEV
jgi:hypothetical protein